MSHINLYYFTQITLVPSDILPRILVILSINHHKNECLCPNMDVLLLVLPTYSLSTAEYMFWLCYLPIMSCLSHSSIELRTNVYYCHQTVYQEVMGTIGLSHIGHPYPMNMWGLLMGHRLCIYPSIGGFANQPKCQGKHNVKHKTAYYYLQSYHGSRHQAHHQHRSCQDILPHTI